jgi:hypothetical protein
MDQNDVEPKEVVMSYIEALDNQRYEKAAGLLDDDVRIRGPAGENFGKPLDFVRMLRAYRSKYDVKKVFADGEDVCVLYDLIIGGSAVYTSSWYQVKHGKIVSVDTIFDPNKMGPPPKSDPARGAFR